MQKVVAEAGRGDYTPYWKRSGVFARAWPEHLDPIRDHWTLYLAGEASFENALRNLVGAVGEGN